MGIHLNTIGLQLLAAKELEKLIKERSNRRKGRQERDEFLPLYPEHRDPWTT